MSTPALAALQRDRIAHVVHPYEHDPAAASYGLEAAAALGVEPDRVFKTLMIDVDDRLCVAIVPVDGRLDLKAAAHALGGKKATMADVAKAQRATGYVAGGISPFGQKRRHPTVVDESALAWDTVFVSAGRRGLDVEVGPDSLITITGARVAALRR